MSDGRTVSNQRSDFGLSTSERPDVGCVRRCRYACETGDQEILAGRKLRSGLTAERQAAVLAEWKLPGGKG